MMRMPRRVVARVSSSARKTIVHNKAFDIKTIILLINNGLKTSTDVLFNIIYGKITEMVIGLMVCKYIQSTINSLIKRIKRMATYRQQADIIQNMHRYRIAFLWAKRHFPIMLGRKMSKSL